MEVKLPCQFGSKVRIISDSCYISRSFSALVSVMAPLVLISAGVCVSACQGALCDVTEGYARDFPHNVGPSVR